MLKIPLFKAPVFIPGAKKNKLLYFKNGDNMLPFFITLCIIRRYNSNTTLKYYFLFMII